MKAWLFHAFLSKSSEAPKSSAPAAHTHIWTAGENVISLTTPSDQYYRNCFINDVALVVA